MFPRRIEDVNSLLASPPGDSLAELYHENSKLRKTNARDFGHYISSFAKLPYMLRKMSHAYKTYPTSLQLSLPTPQGSSSRTSNGLEEIISRRRTIRAFTGEKLPLDVFSKLLFYSCGVTCRVRSPELDDEELCLRAIPSAGALYPLETYLVSWNVGGLEPGLYHYSVHAHALELLAPGGFAASVSDLILSGDLTTQTAAIFFITAMFQRTMIKYSERGYRFALLEAGHLAQNMCLMACELGVGVLPIGGFLDDEVNRFLSIDGVNEAAVYAMAVGALPPSAAGPQ